MSSKFIVIQNFRDEPNAEIVSDHPNEGEAIDAAYDYANNGGRFTVAKCICDVEHEARPDPVVTAYD